MTTTPPVKVIKIFPVECQEFSCPADSGRVEFRSDGEINFVFRVRHKHPTLGWQDHWQRVSVVTLARQAMSMDTEWLSKFNLTLSAEVVL